MTKALQNTACSAIFGLSCYDRNFLHDRCETLKLGLKGIREGYDQVPSDSEMLEGIGLFADYTMDETEWAQYEKWWLDKPPAQNGTTE
jgi:hypothetical protein